MAEAHIAWAEARLPEARARLAPLLGAGCIGFVTAPILVADWIPLHCLVAIDRAIAKLVGGEAEQVFRELGRQSAITNLGGAYKGFVADEPHRFFQQTSLHHGRFQNFGQSAYVKTGDRSGRLKFDGYDEHSPVYCASSVGYFQGALEMMHVPEQASVVEVACRCADDPACVFDLAW
jgi:uncharacterized protein (TIGR02265 family)